MGEKAVKMNGNGCEPGGWGTQEGNEAYMY